MSDRDREYVISPEWDKVFEYAIGIVCGATFLYLGWHIIRAVLR